MCCCYDCNQTLFHSRTHVVETVIWLRLSVFGVRCCVDHDCCDNFLQNGFEPCCLFVVDVVAVGSFAVGELVKMSVNY